jgi:hypothetical protein
MYIPVATLTILLRTLMINLNEKLTTRDGQPVRVYAIDHSGDYPIVGAILCSYGWRCVSWTKEGFYDDRECEDERDLVNPHLEFVIFWWVNIYDNLSVSSLYESKSDADKAAEHSRRIACKQIAIRGSEGDGI